MDLFQNLVSLILKLDAIWPWVASLDQIMKQGCFEIFSELIYDIYTVKMNMLYLINKIVATDYKQYYLLN